MKKFLIAGFVAFLLSAPVFAEMEIPRRNWNGTDSRDDATFNNDGSYMELRNETDNNNNIFRIQLSSGGLIVGSGVPLNPLAEIECGSWGKVFLLPRMDTQTRDTLSNTGVLKDGSTIFNTQTNKINIRANGAWEAVTSS